MKGHGPEEYNWQLASLAMPDNHALLASIDVNGTLSRWDAITVEPFGAVMSFAPGPRPPMGWAGVAGTGRGCSLSP